MIRKALILALTVLTAQIVVGGSEVGAANQSWYSVSSNGSTPAYEADGADCLAGALCFSNLSKSIQRPNPCFFSNTSAAPQCKAYAFGGSSSTAQWIEGGSTQWDCFAAACNKKVFSDTKSVRNRDTLKRTMCIDWGGGTVTYPFATTSWEAYGSVSWMVWNLGLRPNSSNWRC